MRITFSVIALFVFFSFALVGLSQIKYRENESEETITILLPEMLSLHFLGVELAAYINDVRRWAREYGNREDEKVEIIASHYGPSGDAYFEKATLMIVTDTAPDVIIAGEEMLSALSANNQLIDLESLGISCDRHAVFADVRGRLANSQSPICIGRTHRAWPNSFYAIPRGANNVLGASRFISHVISK